MPLRRRLTLSTAIAVAVAVLAVAGVCYLVVSGQLRSQVDDQIRGPAGSIASRLPALTEQRATETSQLPQLSLRDGGLGPYVAIETTAGRRIDPPAAQGVRLPIDGRDRAVRAGAVLLRDREVNGRHLRTATARGEEGIVVIARPVDDIDRVLNRLGLVLVAVAAIGIALAVFLGRSIGRSLVAPIRELAEAAEHVGETEDLGRRLVKRTDDEVGTLVERFNTMLGRLERSRAELDASVAAQRQLVADASHELRTPITSLRTNIEVLLDGGRLRDEQRSALLGDVREQTEELSAIVADVIDLARGDVPLGELEELRLDVLAEEAAVRARRHAPQIEIRVLTVPVTVDGVGERLERTLNNLLDNATGHTPPGGVVEVRVGAGGAVEVRDSGPGVDPADLPFLFDRFYRGTGARSRPGTGLGLAIVKQTAEAHGGTATAANAERGGAAFTLWLPPRG